MNCPKCGKKVSSEDFNCIYCGVQLKSTGADGRVKKKLFGRDKKNKDKPEKTKPETSSPEQPKSDTQDPLPKKDGAVLSGKGKVLKISAIGALSVLVIVLVIVLVSSIASRKGERFAAQASEYIGRSVGDLNQESELFYADTSDCYGINNTVTYDCIGEAEDTVKIQGIVYPEWAVTLSLSDAKFITDVTYTNFALVKNDLRGEKRSEQISLERFHDGDKQSSVLREIDLDPYSITYSQNGTVTYTFKYWYKRDNGDEQAVLMRAVFTEEGKYRYSTAELLFPANM